MSDDESFIVLGSTPTPSMEHYLVNRNCQRSNIMEISSQSNGYSLLHENGSLQAEPSMAQRSIPPVARSSVGGENGSQQTESIISQRSIPSITRNSAVGDNPLAASVILGQTKSSLFQTFPSLMQSSISMDDIQTLQSMVHEHGQMKESLQKANIAMRKNFTNIQKWQDEVKAKYTEHVDMIEKQQLVIQNLEADANILKQALTVAERHNKDLEAQTKQEKAALEQELKELRKQVEAERVIAKAELDELKQAESEKLSILKNMAKEIERLELEKQQFVVVNPNKPSSHEDDLSFMSKEEHNRQIKSLQREMSVQLAKNLEFEDMKKLYIDEINCLKVNVTAADEVMAKYRLQISRQEKDIETKDVSLAENIRELKNLSEQIDVVNAQLEVYKLDFEAERDARAALAIEKDSILTDLRVLQQKHQQLVEQTQNSRVTVGDATQVAGENVNRERTPDNTDADQAASSSTEQYYERPILHCPLCNEAYRDLASLQNHVEDCVSV